jgi:hypothetical protein
VVFTKAFFPSLKQKVNIPALSYVQLQSYSHIFPKPQSKSYYLLSK